MSTKTAAWIVVALIGLTFASSIWLYPQLPETLVSHWNAAGQPNGTLPKFWGLFLTPLIMAACALLFFFLPYLDPLRKNIETFRRQYNQFIVWFVIFLFYVHGLTLLWNTGARFDMGRVIMPALGILFYLIGIMLRSTKRNWFIGIRTPWTLSSDAVWTKTHELGSTLFEASGALTVFGAFFDSRYSIRFLLAPILTSALAVVIYSYVLYQREQHLS